MKQRNLKKSKIFTLAEANNALALIRPIAKDLHLLLKEVSLLDTSKISQDENSPEYQDLLQKMQSHNFKFIHHLKELNSIGVILSDLKNIVIDFPGKHNGKEVYFCWKYNEPEVYYFHGHHCEQHTRKYIYDLSTKIK